MFDNKVAKAHVALTRGAIKEMEASLSYIESGRIDWGRKILIDAILSLQTEVDWLAADNKK